MECRPIHTQNLQFITVNGQDVVIRRYAVLFENSCGYRLKAHYSQSP